MKFLKLSCLYAYSVLAKFAKWRILHDLPSDQFKSLLDKQGSQYFQNILVPFSDLVCSSNLLFISHHGPPAWEQFCRGSSWPCHWGSGAGQVLVIQALLVQKAKCAKNNGSRSKGTGVPLEGLCPPTKFTSEQLEEEQQLWDAAHCKQSMSQRETGKWEWKQMGNTSSSEPWR